MYLLFCPALVSLAMIMIAQLRDLNPSRNS